MRKELEISVERVTPTIRMVLRAQGIPESVAPDGRTNALVEEALAVYRRVAEPVGVVAEVPADEFAEIFEGMGRNEPDNPAAMIHPRADRLALFAVTIGGRMSETLDGLFDESNVALGVMLDSVASEGAEMAADALESRYRIGLERAGDIDAETGLLRFSPGYCGWDISGQKALFDRLGPVTIGIELSESFLMRPIKSISGVIIVGEKDIFDFNDDFPFCADCDSHSCRERIRAAAGR